MGGISEWPVSWAMPWIEILSWWYHCCLQARICFFRICNNTLWNWTPIDWVLSILMKWNKSFYKDKRNNKHNPTEDSSMRQVKMGNVCHISYLLVASLQQDELLVQRFNLHLQIWPTQAKLIQNFSQIVDVSLNDPTHTQLILIPEEMVFKKMPINDQLNQSQDNILQYFVSHIIWKSSAANLSLSIARTIAALSRETDWIFQ